ncbi:hypothetical protein AVEN_52028-1 [Araneus ventricosus]|uniref:Uncharacterized protein n=1 Tax=Araneus ventricosus TaxID=182803 RepID=A0A4Y2CEY1_ARAVE|nr:hypothetical protein AVEN_52028-1 [Araneus ventricosus]
MNSALFSPQNQRARSERRSRQQTNPQLSLVTPLILECGLISFGAVKTPDHHVMWRSDWCDICTCTPKSVQLLYWNKHANRTYREYPIFNFGDVLLLELTSHTPSERKIGRREKTLNWGWDRRWGMEGSEMAPSHD